MLFPNLISRQIRIRTTVTLFFTAAILMSFSGQWVNLAYADIGEFCDAGVEGNIGECISFGRIADSVSFCTYQSPSVDHGEILEKHHEA